MENLTLALIALGITLAMLAVFVFLSVFTIPKIFKKIETLEGHYAGLHRALAAPLAPPTPPEGSLPSASYRSPNAAKRAVYLLYLTNCNASRGFAPIWNSTVEKFEKDQSEVSLISIAMDQIPRESAAELAKKTKTTHVPAILIMANVDNVTRVVARPSQPLDTEDKLTEFILENYNNESEAAPTPAGAAPAAAPEPEAASAAAPEPEAEPVAEPEAEPVEEEQQTAAEPTTEAATDAYLSAVAEAEATTVVENV
jgi:hypothetical protein